jgi:RNA polymerase sigma-70 factor (ECF subfamily)
MASASDADQVTFDALYREHFGFVWRCLRRFGVPARQAEDAAQDTFIVLHRRLGDLRHDASPKGFLFAIALRVARDYRRAGKRVTTELDAENEASTERGPFERAAEGEAGKVLARFLDTLDDDKRAVFVLSELEGMTVVEVSELVRANLNTVYSRLRAARARFEEFFREHGGRHG